MARLRLTATYRRLHHGLGSEKSIPEARVQTLSACARETTEVLLLVDDANFRVVKRR